MDVFFVKSLRVDHTRALVSVELELDDVKEPVVHFFRRDQLEELEAQLAQAKFSMAVERGEVVIGEEGGTL